MPKQSHIDQALKIYRQARKAAQTQSSSTVSFKVEVEGKAYEGKLGSATIATGFNAFICYFGDKNSEEKVPMIMLWSGRQYLESEGRYAIQRVPADYESFNAVWGEAKVYEDVIENPLFGSDGEIFFEEVTKPADLTLAYGNADFNVEREGKVVKIRVSQFKIKASSLK